MAGLHFNQIKLIAFTAFTLAEVLITLGIIGVVAAMTIPTLMNKTNELEYKIGLKKGYSVISQAFASLINDNGGTAENLCTSGDYACFRDAMGKYINFIKTCDINVTGCWTTNNITYLNNYASTGSVYKGTPTAVLKDGSELGFEYGDSTCSSNWYSQVVGFTVCGAMVLDVNGNKSPNTVGKDQFQFWVLKDRILPFGSKGDAFDGQTSNSTNYCDTSSSFSGNGYYCTFKYLTE